MLVLVLTLFLLYYNVTNIIKNINNDEKKYYSLPQLYLKANENFQLKGNTPVYLFGFSGMGQFYAYYG